MSGHRPRPPSRPSDSDHIDIHARLQILQAAVARYRARGERNEVAEARYRAAIGARNRAAREAIEREIAERRRRSQEGSQAATERYRTANELVRSILDDRPPTAEVSPSGELLRAIEARYHPASAESGPRQHLSPNASSGRSMSSDPTRDLQRRFSRDPQERNSETLPSLSSLSSGGPALPPLRSLGSRRGPTMSGSNGGTSGRPVPRYRPSDRFLERQRNAWEQSRNSNSTFEDLDQHLEDANSHLRALLDFPTMSPLPSIGSPPSRGQDHSEEPRGRKRRKLDPNTSSSGYKGFRYGRYGQVEPGRLTMEIVSCDGGMYSDESSYAAENILKNDNSVYCTKGNRCNIVLRHQGATVFSLKELVVKAPGSNYSSPVREGMVFVSMDSDELLARTAQYQIQYVSANDPTKTSVEREGWARGRGGQGRAAVPILSIRHNEDGTTMTRAQIRQRRLANFNLEEDEDYRTAQLPSEFNVSPPQFHVTTECSDDENEAAMPRYRRRTPNRIGALPFESDSSEDGGPFSAYDYAFLDDVGPLGDQHSENMTLAEAAEASQIATQEAVRAVGGELMAPHARFYIEQEKSKCTIKFDPPVSGRFILLKMWSPRHNPHGNIDIEGVVAKGYAGPRYFPSVELR
ncbi:Regulator of chromosome condensation (RCC1)-like protein [Pleurostoma richardsiae]|uniref:Regulator of chromosome condensation (RCC1)-like protein n=1 Tax=Pleurostoma richardsiae TaxID=41990 RepID=A0AA38RMW4_9PEZI|nr:Regulator of chromosome condensation (RCC1)-like protein [Pleurostoma richardsiae]